MSSHDDPRLTALALGEQDGDERAEIEARVAADPDLKREVEAITRTADFLTTTLARRESPVLTRERRQIIEERIQAGAMPRPARDREAIVQARSSLMSNVFGLGIVGCIVGVIVIAGLNATGSSVNSLIHKAPMYLVNESRENADYRPALSPAGYLQDASDNVLREREKAHRDGLEEGPRQAPETTGTEAYAPIVHNPFLRVEDQPLSTFSIDVDTASYANVRRFLTRNTLPPADAVRVEEMINYFPYDYPDPEGTEPITVHAETAACPWKGGHRLVKIGVKGRAVDLGSHPSSNLVFLIDVSGSMSDPTKLPLLKQALGLLMERLGENDRVAMVVYAGASGLVLPSTTGDHGSEILAALENLQAGGSTNGGAGIELAYRVAVENFIKGGVNRVLLATDGDFNVGTTSRGALLDLIQSRARTGVFLTVLGFGMGNYKDSTLEMLADKGNGNYAYIDNLREARKVLVEQASGTLVTIAKDVKIQVEFNPARIVAYRLIGYENRLLAARDFNDDTKDAGELGAGHTVTALYELVPVGAPDPTGSIDPLRYDKRASPPPAPSPTNEVLFVKLRYKHPDESHSQKLTFPVHDSGKDASTGSTDFKFASAVAAFGMILRDSPHRGDATLASVLEWGTAGRGPDAAGHRQEFLTLVQAARGLMPNGR